MKDYEWLDNFYKQQEKFFGVRFGNHTVSPAAGGYQEFDRDNAGGFMEYITALVKKHYGIVRKDTWNPADIWLVWNPREAKQEIELAVSEHIGTIKYLNDVLRTMLKDHRVVGISLKKISGKKAKWETVNLARKFTFIGPGPPKFEWSNGNAVCWGTLVTGKYPITEKTKEDNWYRLLTPIERNPEFIKGFQQLFVTGQPLPKGLTETDDNVIKPVSILAWEAQELKVTIDEDSKPKYELTIKSQHTGSSTGQTLKFEPKDLHATAARLGKAESQKVSLAFKELGSIGWDTYNRWQQYPSTLAQWNSQQKNVYKGIVNRITPWVQVGVTGNEFAQNVTTLFKQYELVHSFNSTVSQRLRWAIVAKLMQLQVANMLFNMKSRKFVKNPEVNQLEVWLTRIAYMAQKKGPGFGPFGKLY